MHKLYVFPPRSRTCEFPCCLYASCCFLQVSLPDCTFNRALKRFGGLCEETFVFETYPGTTKHTVRFEDQASADAFAAFLAQRGYSVAAA